MSASGYGRADVSTFGQNWPGASTPAPATAQVAGVAQQATNAVKPSEGSATLPWVTCIAVLLVIRILSHVRGN